MEHLYRANQSGELDQDYQAAKPFAKMRVGEKNLYWKKLVRWYYMPFEEIRQVYWRIEEVTSYTSCCQTDFSIHKLGIIRQDDAELIVQIGQELYRHEPEKLLEALREMHPEIRIAKPVREAAKKGK